MSFAERLGRFARKPLSHKRLAIQANVRNAWRRLAAARKKARLALTARFSPEATMLHQRPDLALFASVTLHGHVFEAKRVTVTVPAPDYEVTLRLQTTDIPTFQQIFIAKEYDCPNLPPDARIIVDLGANIGLSAVFFGRKYPSARLIAVEPDPSNFLMLLNNVSALGDRVATIRAAAWSTDGEIPIGSEDTDGNSLGAWGLRVCGIHPKSSVLTRCLSIPTIIKNFGLTTIDILKIDIEGAELEIFSSRPLAWLDDVKMIMVETHDRFCPGSEAAVRVSLAKNFVELPRIGENLVFRRLG